MKQQVGKFVLVCMCCGLILLSSCETTKPKTLDSILTTLQGLTVTVCNGTKGHGSGVFIGPNLVVTAGHCVEAVPTYVMLKDGTAIEITGMWRSPDYDIGFLWVNCISDYVELGSVGSLKLGDTLYHIGTPLDRGLNNSVFKGIVGYLERSWCIWKNVFQADFWSSSGCSGGPVFDENGKLVGIVVGGSTCKGTCIVVCEGVNHIKEALDKYNQEKENAQSNGRCTEAIRP